ncbi:hypothetical protein QQY66_13965 [Streptomyces sp. DG2A-72]|uniref:hypothetical protein n=1 Tax=Streptomyces sp. DG2A-72 TaxID=3051386 RepID=UPI00265BFF2A|nr:hypothetical protein [Streptomyces sp. DG2A-72]MDO0932746.1 hypothetical protein [Streptomyces sp. DG2A-72]
MSRLVPRFETTAALIQATNEVREQVVRALAAYIELSGRMREFEDTFSTQVLHAAQQLHDIIGQRRRLEAELDRIRTRIERDGYESAQEIEDYVHAVLTAEPDDAAETARRGAVPDAEDEPIADGDDGLDDAARKRIVRDFKRIVLPSVHADTSDASFAVFDVAYSAYKAKDHVVMEALVIQYRGEIGAEDDAGRTVLQEEAAARLSEYRAAARRLDERLRSVRRHVTDAEVHNPEETRLRMRQRNEQIRRAIDEEAEQVLELRRRLEALLDSARDGSDGTADE